MWNSEAFDTEFLIDFETRPEIGLKQVAVNFAESIEGQGAAVVLDFVHLFFELGEHGLPKQDLANVLDLAVDEVSPHRRFLGAFLKIVGEEFFVKCGGYFREKDRVAVVLKE